MKKIMFVFMALIALMSIANVFAQTTECVNCCDGGECGPEDANTPTLDLYSCSVEVNGDLVYPDDVGPEVVQRGDTLEIKVRLQSKEIMEDVQVTAIMTGYQRSERLVDMTDTFDLKANDRESFYLELHVPDDWDLEKGDDDIVNLRILVSDDSHDTFDEIYRLRFKPKRDSVVIKDIVLDPASKVQAGRGLFASVRVRNMGRGDEESLKVTTSIPELGIKATEYIDELKQDESTSSEDMFLRIPTCVEAGVYTVRAEVEYAYGDEMVSDETSIEILENPECSVVNPGTEDKTVVTVPGKQDVIKGTTGTVYPLILENRGVTDKTYQLSVSGTDTWATYRFDPGTLVLIKAGEMKTVYLYVTPSQDAQAGEKVFMVSVETDGDKKQIALTANVVEGSNQSPGNLDLSQFKGVLEVGLIVLVVLLVILGLIVGFNKLKGNDDETEEISGQTYY